MFLQFCCDPVEVDAAVAVIIIAVILLLLQVVIRSQQGNHLAKTFHTLQLHCMILVLREMRESHCARMHMCLCAHAHVCACMHVCVYVCMCGHVCVCVIINVLLS